MRGLTKRRAIAALSGVVAVAAVAVTIFSGAFGRGAAAAPTPYNAHRINVHPNFQRLDDSSTQPNAHFGCQDRPIGAVRCYDPQQIRAAYNTQSLLDAGVTGAGRTIVIIDAFQSPTIAADLELFNTVFGLPSATLNIFAPDGLTPFDQNDANMAGWAGEITLDVEWAHAIAPAATIDLVLAKSNQDVDILSATKFAVDHNLGDAISQSFGEAEECVDPRLMRDQHKVFQQATSQKITLFASSGDDGAAQPNCDGSALIKAASSPASDPLVTAVGGTQLNADANGAYISETTWNNAFGSSGGGLSAVYHRPGYQSHEVDNNKTRGVPDVAYDGDVDGGVLTVWTPPIAAGGDGTTAFVFIFGGTSAGSPQWAGIAALADQAAGHRLGFLNTRLYHISRRSGASSFFHDITTGNNSVDSIIGFDAVTGWDAATGLGSPNVANLVPQLIDESEGVSEAN